MVTGKKQSRILSLLMNGILIGKLEKMVKGNLLFHYEESWLNTPNARPVSLSLPLIQRSYESDLVYNFFDNLLPDNPQIRKRIQAKYRIPTSQPFDLLASIGKDCVGAIQLIEGDLKPSPKAIKFEKLTNKQIAETLRNYQEHPLGMYDNDDFRISIAGAQEKSAFLYHQGQWCKPIADTPTTHIFKLPIGYISHQNIDLTESCENEWLCLKIAEAFGLPTAKSEILKFEDVKVLVVKRFDRKLSQDGSWIMRLPQEDMCQVLGVSPNLKYQADGGPGIKDIMQLLLGSADVVNDRDLFYRAQVLFWLLAAIDGHAKNFSIFIEPRGTYRLTPLYDIMSAYPLIANKQLHERKIKMAMALRGKHNHYHWYNIRRDHFIETAKYANYPADVAETILDEMLEKVDSVIEKVAAELPKQFPSHIAQPIFDGMRAMRDKLSSPGETRER